MQNLNTSTQYGVSINGGTPSHHPFLIGIFHAMIHPAIGLPPGLWKPPCETSVCGLLYCCGCYGSPATRQHQLTGFSLHGVTCQELAVYSQVPGCGGCFLLPFTALGAHININVNINMNMNMNINTHTYTCIYIYT